MKYRVYVPLTGCNQYTVDADSAEEAVKKVASGDGDYQCADSWTEENVDTGLWDAQSDNN